MANHRGSDGGQRGQCWRAAWPSMEAAMEGSMVVREGSDGASVEMAMESGKGCTR